MNPALDKLDRACGLLDRGRFEEAAKLIEEPREAASESVQLAARGLIHERDGERSPADECFRRVFDLGVPLPATLRQSGSYFKRTGDHERAHHCYSLLQNLDGRAMAEFLPPTAGYDFEPAELARYAPAALNKRHRGGPWVVWPIKEALESHLGWEATAVLFGALSGEGWDVGRRSLTSLHDFSATAGSVHEELSPSREVELPAIPILGEKREGFQGRARSVFFTALEDVVVSSKSNLILTDDRALLDFQGDELDRIAVDFHVDPIVLAKEGEQVTALVAGEAVSEAPLERSLSLLGVNSGNFGHWLLEFLPKVWICGRRPGFGSVPILVDEQMPTQHVEALRLFVGPDHPIVVVRRGEAVHVRELWTCATVGYFPLAPKTGAAAATDPLVFDEEPLVSLLSEVRPGARARSEGTGPKRIYLSRQATQPHRQLVNRAEVEAWFRGHGFEVLDFGELSFADQLELIQGAEIVAGPDGSSFMTTLLAGPGLRIGVLDNPYLRDNAWYVLISRALGQRVLYLTGDVVEEDPEYSIQSSYEIDVAALPRFLDELSSAP